MDFSYALTFIFEDRQWLSKIVLLLIVLLLSFIPIFGLLAFAVALGFLVQLAANVRNGLPRPLPKWDDYGVKLNAGGPLLLAMLFYNLPLVLLSLCATWVVSGIGSGFLGDTAGLIVLCCVLPFALVYTALTWPLLAIGLSEYIETGDTRRLFRPLHQYDVLQANGGLVGRWALYAFLVNTALLVALWIPCLGWVAMMAFGLPVHGHLLGQFAQKLSLVNQLKVQKRKKL